MKRLILFAAVLVAAAWYPTALTAGVNPKDPAAIRVHRTPKDAAYKWTNGTQLTVVGKMFTDTPNPWWRIDTDKYKGFTEAEQYKIHSPSGISLSFRTNSSSIKVRLRYGWLNRSVTTNFLAHRGVDLYVHEKGQWVWAGSGAPGIGKEEQEFSVVLNMEPSTKEFLLYLPIYNEVNSIEIGTEQGSVLEAAPNPFRHRVGIYGSSYTHGVCCGRAGMTYPAQFSRSTGIQLLSIAMSGSCKMQSYVRDAICDADVEAMIFDTFSNPTIDQIRERLFPFIEAIQKAHPGIPLIFQRTIYRTKRNYNTAEAKKEADRIAFADSMMTVACKRYKDVYYIHPNATDPKCEAALDGVHPSDYGYTLWEQSIEKKVLRILRKYGIR